MKMKRSFLFPFLFIVLLFPLITLAQTNTIPKDYLTVPGPLSFNNTSYHLSWTSHPADNYYKQEYLVKGDTADHFNTMLMLEVLTGAANVKSLVDSKVAELKAMKASNPIVTYDLTSNTATGEYFLDFVLSQNAADGKVLIAERNIYRYTTFTDKTGKKNILLFGISVRRYGNDTHKFLADLKLNKNELLAKVKQFTIPSIAIKR